MPKNILFGYMDPWGYSSSDLEFIRLLMMTGFLVSSWCQMQAVVAEKLVSNTMGFSVWGSGFGM